MIVELRKFAPSDKIPGDLIKSEDWNEATEEIKRLEKDKLNREGADSLQGPLTIREALGVGITDPNNLTAKLQVEGNAIVSGNVGIGSTNPRSSLEIQKSVAGGLGPILTLCNIAGGVNAGGAIDFKSYTSDATRARIQSLADGTGSCHLSFSTNEVVGDSNSLRERLRIQANGNVGINTTDPKAKLDIAAQTRTNSHPTDRILYVTGGMEAAAKGVEFRKSDATEGIGFGCNTIYAAGSSASQDLNLKAGTSGKVKIGSALETQGVSATSLTMSGNLSVTGNTTLSGSLSIGSGTTAISINDGNVSATSLAASNGLTISGGNAIVNNGNVGIGTNNPDAKLHIISQSTDAKGKTLVLGPTTDTFLSLGYNTSYGWIQSFNSKPLALNPLNNNVGIGTTDPKAKLQVSGATATPSIGTTEIIRLLRPAAGTGTSDKAANAAGLSLGTFEIGASGKTRLDFKLSETGENPNVNVMTLQADGKVGIGLGTETLGANLHVAGEIGKAEVGTAEIIRLLRPLNMEGSTPKKNSTSAGLFLGTFEGSAAGRARLDFRLSGTPVERNKYGREPDINVMTLQADGNVGIGAESPKARLDITTQTRTGSHPTDRILYVTGGMEAAAKGVEFRTSDATEGIGFSFNTIYAAGSSASQDLNLKAGTSGKVKIGSALETQEVSATSLTMSGNLSVTGSTTLSSSLSATSLSIGSGDTAVSISNGSVSAKSLTASNGLTISGGNTIVNSGNVGIGIVNPDAKLHIINQSTDTSGKTLVLGSTGANQTYLSLGYTANYGWIQSFNSKPLALNPLNNNVGIGTIDPKAKLDIATQPRTTNNHPPDQILYVTGEMNAAKGVEFRTSDATEGIGFGCNTIYAAGSNTNQDLNLQAKGATSKVKVAPLLETDRLTVTGTGNTEFKGPVTAAGLTVTETGNAIVNNGRVGIGTTSPDVKLHVVGSSELVRFVHSTDSNTFMNIGFSETGGGKLEIASWANGWGINTKAAQKHLYLNRDSGDNSNVYIGKANQDICIKYDGNVGLSVDPTARLDVGGLPNTPHHIGLQLRSGNNNNNLSSNQVTFGFSLDNASKYRHAIKTRHCSNSRSGNAIDFYVWKGPSGTDKDADTTIGTLHTMSLDGGNVGIGTMHPTVSLDVGGDIKATGGISAASFSTENGNISTTKGTISAASLSITGTSNTTFSGSISAAGLTVTGTGNAIVNNGNVGIGIAAPTARLDVVKGSNASNPIALQLRGGNTTGSTTSNQITFSQNDTLNYRHVIKTRHSSNSRSGNAIDFYVWKWLSGTDKDGNETIGTLHTMSLDGGNVGIGKTDPTAKLDVSGDIKATGSVSATSLTASGSLSAASLSITGTSNTTFTGSISATGFSTTGSVSTQGLEVVGSTNFIHSSALTIINNTSNGGTTPNGTIDVLSLTRTGVSQQSNANRVSLAIGRYENATNRASRTQLDIKLTDESDTVYKTIMSLRSNGNIGIGTTNPTAKLDVSGDIKATGSVSAAGLIVSGTGNAIVNNGKVGIGTDKPDAKLEVVGGTTKLQQEDWTNMVPLNSNWVSSIQPQYFKDSLGIVHLQGTVRTGTNATIFTLPVGYRSSAQLCFVVATYSGYSKVVLRTDGQITLPLGNDGNWVALDGITFRAA